jgi:hypothetical protein
VRVPLPRRPALQARAERVEGGDLALEGGRGRLAARPVAGLDQPERDRGGARGDGRELEQPRGVPELAPASTSRPCRFGMRNSRSMV